MPIPAAAIGVYGAPRSVSTIAGLLLAIPGVLAAGAGLYLVALALASIGFRVPETAADYVPSRRIAVLIPAYNEELLVARCVDSMRAQLYPPDRFRILVIADNCTDGTVSAAAAAGAEVLVRDEADRPGKGRALRWAMDRLGAQPEAPEAFVIVDADSIADPNLLRALVAELEAGHEIVQAEYALAETPGDRAAAMTGAGFLLFHRLRFRGRARLGMAANLVGNGMLLSARAVAAVPWTAYSPVEDLEQSIRFRLSGFRPRFAAAARVYGAAAGSSAGAVRQRLRWEGGRFAVVRHALLPLIGAALFDAALDLATPPLALLTLIACVGTAIALIAAAAGLVAWWTVAPWAVATASIPCFVVVGLWSAGGRARIWLVVLGAPAFVAWKVGAYLRLLRGFDSTRWDRTDRIAS